MKDTKTKINRMTKTQTKTETKTETKTKTKTRAKTRAEAEKKTARWLHLSHPAAACHPTAGAAQAQTTCSRPSETSIDTPLKSAATTISKLATEVAVPDELPPLPQPPPPVVVVVR